MSSNKEEYVKLVNYYRQVKNSDLYKTDLKKYISLMLGLELKIRQLKVAK